jgi:hypothetical protein
MFDGHDPRFKGILGGAGNEYEEISCFFDDAYFESAFAVNFITRRTATVRVVVPMTPISHARKPGRQERKCDDLGMWMPQ